MSERASIAECAGIVEEGARRRFGRAPAGGSRGGLRTPGRRVAGMVLASALVVGACASSAEGPQPPAVPDESAGIAIVNQLVAAATGGNLNAICGLGSGTCPHDLRNAAPGTAPSAPPRVMGSWVVEPVWQAASGTWSVGGRAFGLCGTDGLGARYYSEVLVFDSGGGALRAINAVFWTGARIATSAETATAPPRASCP